MKLIVKIIFSIVVFCVSNPSFAQLNNEGFEGATFPPTTPGNWLVMDNGVNGTPIESWKETTVAANVHSGTKAAFIERENIGNGNTSQDWLITPQITILPNGELKFFTKQTVIGNQGTTYQVRLSTDPIQSNQAAYTTILQTWTETTLNTTYNVYEEKIVGLNAYAGQAVYLAFVKINTQTGFAPTGDRWLIDDVQVVQKCLEPIFLGVAPGSITPTGATLTWTQTGTVTNWQVEVLPTGNTPTGVGVVAGTNPFPYSGLTLGTAYQYYVRAYCGGGNYSQWGGPFNFTTSPAGSICSSPIIITSLPFSQTANTETFGDEVDTHQGSGCAGGTNYLQGDEVFYSYTPAVSGNVSVSMTPTQRNSSIFVYDGCSNVGVSCIAGAADTTNTRRDVTFSAISGHNYVIVISSSTTPISGINYNLLIQQSSPTCLRPTNLAATSISTTDANFSWNNQAGVTWQVELVRNTSANINYIPASPISAATNSYHHSSSLISGSSYSLWVRSVCSGSVYSEWIRVDFLTYCDTPEIIGQGDYTGTSATLSFSNGNNSPSTFRKEISIKPYKFGDVGSPSGLFTTSGQPNTYNATGLESDIIYNAFVRSDCGANGNSAWSPPVIVGAFAELGSCIREKNDIVQARKALVIGLINDILHAISIGQVVNENFYSLNLQALGQYISDPNPKIYNFSFSNGTLGFSFSKHPGATRKDVVLTGYSTSFGLMTNFDFSSYYSPDYFMYEVPAYFGANQAVLTLKHVNFCSEVCVPVEGGITVHDCLPGKNAGGCVYTCGDRTVFPTFLNDDETDEDDYDIIWEFVNPSGTVIGTSQINLPSFTFVTPGINTIVYKMYNERTGCWTTFSIKVSVVACVSCTATNPRSPLVKQLFIKLVNHLHERAVNDDPIPDGYDCEDLDLLRHYITDKDALIYNFEKEPFSFSFHKKGKKEETYYDVLIDKWEYFNSLTVADVDVTNFSDAANFTNLDEKIKLSDESVLGKAEVRHINFCPEELCVNHVAIVLDESGSIDFSEKAKIKRQIKGFLKQQADWNEINHGNMFISLFGMSDRDANVRTDHIPPTRITNANLSLFINWLDGNGTPGSHAYGYKYQDGITGLSQGSDFWKSGLDAALQAGTTKKLDMVVMFTDGSQTANPAGLKSTLSQFNNYSNHYGPFDETKPHLYVIGIDNGFYVYDEQSAGRQLPQDQDPNYVPTLRSSSPESRVTPALSLSLKYLLNLVYAEFPFESGEDFKKDNQGYLNFDYIGDEQNEFYLSNKVSNAITVGNCIFNGGKDNCDDCFSFQPIIGKPYVLNAWAKEDLNIQVKEYENPKIRVKFIDAYEGVTFKEFATTGDIIEGWQRIGGKFEAPVGTKFIEFELINESNNGPVFFDDIRIYPIKGSMKSFVYDPETFRLMSELDENNYATYYEYDSEGGLVRIKKETAQGVKTIQETRSGTATK